MPLNNASWIGTHNSFNNEADSSTRVLFEDVPNQIYTVPEQLVLGARVIEVCGDSGVSVPCVSELVVSGMNDGLS